MLLFYLYLTNPAHRYGHTGCLTRYPTDSRRESALNLDTASCGLDQDSLRGLQGENGSREV